MPKIDLLNIKGEKIKDIKLNDEIWNIEPNNAVLYDAVNLALSSLRQGTHKVKTRSEVSGGGRKPWRQKGTGRARAGSIRAPHWRGGGIVFGPQPRSYDKKMNKKERRLALKSALSFKVIANELKVIDSLILNNAKTVEFKNLMKELKIDKSVLFVTADLSDNLILASRNIKDVKVILAGELNAYDVTCYDYLVVTEEAMNKIEEVLV